MRKIPTQKEISYLYNKHIKPLEKKKKSDYRIGEHFQKCYFEFIDKYELGNCEDDKKKQEMIIFFDLLILKEEEWDCGGQWIYNLVGKYYRNCPTHGVIAINKQCNKLLLVESIFQKFGFVKGKAHQGEKAIKCAARQFKEEIELQIHLDFGKKIMIDHKNKGFCCFYVWTTNQKYIEEKSIQDLDPKKRLNSYENKSIRWYTFNEVEEMVANDNMNYLSREVFLQLKDFLKKNKKPSKPNLNQTMK